MSQISNEKSASLETVSRINAVEGFHPEAFAVEFIDLTTGESRKRLPVMIQMAWFRLKYPEGRLSVQVTPGKDCFVATARVYRSYQDPMDCFLAEATASRGPDPNKPSVSPREWAQTAAVGIALRNAGFGLQFSAAGEEFEGVSSEGMADSVQALTKDVQELPTAENTDPVNYETVSVEFSEEQKLQKAMRIPCPIKKYADKTLGDLIVADAKALNWIATRYTGNPEIMEAAKRICEYALQQASA